MVNKAVTRAGLMAAGALGAAAAAFAARKSRVETPGYDVLEVRDGVELRHYPKLILAETDVTGERQSAIETGFRRLADYIFARSRAGEKIAMTAPVEQSAGEEAGAWTVRFIMPSKYERKKDLPDPQSNQVRLAKRGETRFAAIRFSGRAETVDIEDQEAQLRRVMAKAGWTPDGPATYAFYNAPWKPGPLRRNEVLIPVK